MTMQTLARVIVETVLHTLDAHTFAGIPAADIERACGEVVQILQEESAVLAEPEEETC